MDCRHSKYAMQYAALSAMSESNRGTNDLGSALHRAISGLLVLPSWPSLWIRGREHNARGYERCGRGLIRGAFKLDALLKFRGRRYSMKCQ